jgi:hypothetical protein
MGRLKNFISVGDKFRFEDFEKAIQSLDALGPAILIQHEREGRGIAVCLGESLSEKWQSGDVIVFWPNGDHTTIRPDDLVQVVSNDLYWADQQ